MNTKKLDFDTQAEEIFPKLIEWRRHFHKYPELSFQESHTSEKIIQVLRSFGLDHIQSGVGGYGIIATLSTGEGPVIGIRADIDALPILEQSSLEYVSQHQGIMHACGHDAHTAILLGVAKLLVENFEETSWRGTVKLIFQPAEESCDDNGETGAVKVLKSGILDDLDGVLALHMCPWRKRGSIQIHDGPSMANNDEFHLVIKGRGGHGGYPHKTLDPLWMATYVLQALYSLNGRKVDPLQVGTVSIGQIYGGEAHNIIPSTVNIKGTLRSYEGKIREQLAREVEQVCLMINALGGDYELSIQQGEPALVNDPSINKLFRKAGEGMEIFEEPFGMGSEDFSYMTTQIPGAMFFLGCGLEQERSLHHPSFDIDEKAMVDGVAIMMKSIENFFKG